MADFSSQGPPTSTVGVNPGAWSGPASTPRELGPRSFCGGAEWFSLQGTSMATPAPRRLAAVARQQHPAWSAAQVRSAIVNTADEGVLKALEHGRHHHQPVVGGEGRENLASAGHGDGAARSGERVARPRPVRFRSGALGHDRGGEDHRCAARRERSTARRTSAPPPPWPPWTEVDDHGARRRRQGSGGRPLLHHARVPGAGEIEVATPCCSSRSADPLRRSARRTTRRP